MIQNKFTEIYNSLKKQARESPQEPGVYLWRNAEKHIIYVGKAKNLKNRLASYFSGNKDIKTQTLIKKANSIESIIVSNEYEALLLENTLIKQHSPRYNINLKDGKTYPVVRISAGDYPRVFKTRYVVEDGSEYFGPFPNVFALNQVMELIEKLFPLRKCKTFKKRKNPCVYYHIKRCLSPCCKEVADEYMEYLTGVRQLLQGETSLLIIDLSTKMHEAARDLNFEKAIEIRNMIQAIESLSENNTVEDMTKDSRDYIAWASEGIFTTFSVLSMREGRMTGQELFSSRSVAEEMESLETFITAYYNPSASPPEKIFLQAIVQNTEKFEFAILGQFFNERFGQSVQLIIPGAGDEDKKHLAALAMARQNAKEDLRKRLRERGIGPAIDELSQVLTLNKRPENIEAFDISHLGGKHTTASLVSFKNGAPDRKNYRHYKLRTLAGRIDDYASIAEAVKRRYSSLLKEEQELPDLILIDGGMGQVNAAKTVLDELGMKCALIGLAKREEEIFVHGSKTAIVLEKRSEALKLLQFIRDETHRFANRLNQKLRQKDLAFSVLESIEGVGSKRAAIIMKTYGSLEKIAAASYKDLSVHCGIPENTAKALIAGVKLKLQGEKSEDKNSSAAALAEEALRK